MRFALEDDALQAAVIVRFFDVKDWQFVRQLLEDGRDRDAVIVASSIRGLGRDRDAIQKAASAMRSPRFYVDIGVDVESVIAQGVAATKERAGYGTSTPDANV